MNEIKIILGLIIVITILVFIIILSRRSSNVGTIQHTESELDKTKRINRRIKDRIERASKRRDSTKRKLEEGFRESARINKSNRDIFEEIEKANGFE